MLRRTLIIAVTALLAALLVGVAGAIFLLHEPPHAV